MSTRSNMRRIIGLRPEPVKRLGIIPSAKLVTAVLCRPIGEQTDLDRVCFIYFSQGIVINVP
jgi:hypothetical protein